MTFLDRRHLGADQAGAGPDAAIDINNISTERPQYIVYQVTVMGYFIKCRIISGPMSEVRRDARSFTSMPKA
jgi:hypothetical protein